MPENIDYTTNPLHGVSLEKVITELVNHYDWDILYAYLNINCFNKSPSIASSMKFLKKTQWAREKVEAFYLYQFKSLPKADDVQFLLPPRERVIPPGIVPYPPKELSFEDAEKIREKKAQKNRQRANSSNDPWAKSR